jgi:hypothetical protein
VHRKEVFDRSEIKSFLAAEIVRDSGLVNSGGFSQLAGGSALEVIGAEDFSGSVQETSTCAEIGGDGERLAHGGSYLIK